MDEIWYDYYKIINDLTISNFENITSLTSQQFEEEIEGKIISLENITIPSKSSSRINFLVQSENKKESYTHEPVEKLYKNGQNGLKLISHLHYIPVRTCETFGQLF